MASETNHPVWQPPVPMELLNFLSYTVAAEYAANKLQQSVNFGAGVLDIFLRHNKSIIERKLQEDGGLSKILECEMSIRESGAYIAQFCTEVVARSAYVKDLLSVKSSLKEPDQYTSIITLSWPGFPNGIEAKARLTQPPQKGGFSNGEEVATLLNDLTDYLDGVDEATPVTLEHIARRLGNSHFTDRLYKPYNL